MTYNKMRCVQQGFSLIELMIAMVLGLFLSFGLSTVFISSNLTYVSDEESTRMQENARYALRTLGRELSMSSFMAGLIEYDNLTAYSLSTDCAANDWATTVSIGGLEVIDNWQSGSLDSSISNTFTCVDDVATNSDVLAVKRTADQPTALNGVLSVASADDEQLYLRVQDYTVPVFEYLADGDSFDSLAAGYDYWKYFVKVFFVRDYSNSDGDNIPTLCVSSLTGEEMETNCLAEGIEAFQIEFGIDSDADGTANYFSAAPDATENTQIIAAKIYVLTRSIGTVPNYTDDKVYTLGSTQMNGGAAFNDGFQRRVYSTTVRLRNPVTL